MKKLTIIFLIFVSLLMHGCSVNSSSQNRTDTESIREDGYNAGYEDGYNAGYESCLNDATGAKYEDEYQDFKLAIINLMYDYEYDAVRKIHQHYKNGVEAALENEFGTKDIDAIVNYLESYRIEQEKMVVGTCKYCGKTVYNSDAVHLSSDCTADSVHQSPADCPTHSYVHKECLFQNDPPKIEKEP